MYIIKLNEKEGQQLKAWLKMQFEKEQVVPSVVSRLIHRL